MDGIMMQRNQGAKCPNLPGLYLACLCVALTACAGKPVDVECKGKGTITWTGVAGATLQADCGEGFSYKSVVK